MNEQITVPSMQNPEARQPDVTPVATLDSVAYMGQGAAPVAFAPQPQYQTSQPVVATEPVPQQVSAFCGNCGTEIPKGMKFCPNCGKSAGVAAVAPAPKKSRKLVPVIIGAVALVIVAIIACVILLAPPSEVPATDLVLSNTQIELKEEENATVSATVYPQDATNKTVVWTSSDEKVATVNNLGTITAVGKGTCIITVQCGTLAKTINVTVKSKIDFKALYEAIDSDVKYGWSVGSDGSYLSADTNVYDLDDYTNSSIWSSIKEMNKKLGLPASLTEDMGNTTWSMGRQNKVYNSLGLEVTWTYHPDKGMEVTYKLLAD